jgi:hypothetical protein
MIAYSIFGFSILDAFAKSGQRYLQWFQSLSIGRISSHQSAAAGFRL